MARTSIARFDELTDQLKSMLGPDADTSEYLNKAQRHFSKVVGKPVTFSCFEGGEWSVRWYRNVGVGECVECVVYCTTEELVDSPFSVVDARIRECMAL